MASDNYADSSSREELVAAIAKKWMIPRREADILLRNSEVRDAE